MSAADAELLTTAELVAIVRAASTMSKRVAAREAASEPGRAADAWETILRFVRATMIAEGAAASTWEPDVDGVALQAVRDVLAYQKAAS